VGKVHNGGEVLPKLDALHPSGDSLKTFKVFHGLLEVQTKRRDCREGGKDVGNVVKTSDGAMDR
jgi:hypothetical protein